MDIVKKLMSEKEINDTEMIIREKLKLSDDIFNNEVINFNLYPNDDAHDLVVAMLNNFTFEFDEELDHHIKNHKNFELNVGLIKPYAPDKLDIEPFIYLSVTENDDGRKFYVMHNDSKIEIDVGLFNCLIAYLVAHGTVYNYEINSIVKN